MKKNEHRGQPPLLNQKVVFFSCKNKCSKMLLVTKFLQLLIKKIERFFFLTISEYSHGFHQEVLLPNSMCLYRQFFVPHFAMLYSGSVTQISTAAGKAETRAQLFPENSSQTDLERFKLETNSNELSFFNRAN